MITDTEKIVKKYSYEDFEKVLHMPFIHGINEVMFQFYAKLHSFGNLNSLMSIIYCTILLIQEFLTVMLFPIAIREGNDEISSIFRLISPILCGGGFFGLKGARITTGVATAIDILLIIIIFWRSYNYKRKKTITQIEIDIILPISRYVIPLTLPFVATGIPICIMAYFTGQGEPSYIVLAVISIIIIMISIYMIYHFFYPRVMFAKEILHCWESSGDLRTILAVVFSTLLLTSAQFTDKYFKMITAICQCCIYLAISLFEYRTKCYVNPVAFKTVCVLSATMASMSLVNVTNVFIPISQGLHFGIFAILFIIMFFVVGYIHQNSLTKYIAKMDAFEDDPNSLTPKELEISIKATINLCLPSIFSFSNIERIITANKKCDGLIIVYTRLISAFPHYNLVLNKVINMLNESNIKTRRTLSLQLQMTALRRSSSTTPEIISFFQNSDEFIRAIDAATVKFWDNVIDNNVLNFWSCLDNRNETVKDLHREATLIGSIYENSPEVLSRIVTIESNISYEYDNIPRLKEAIDDLSNYRPAHPDRAMENILKVFPGVANISNEFTEDIKIIGSIIDKKEKEFQEYEEKRCIYDMISNSSVGKSNYLLIYLFIASIILSFFIIYFFIQFNNDVVTNVTKITDVYLTLNSLLFNIARYSFIKYSRQSLLAPNSPLRNDDETMKMNSPNWFGKYDDVPRFNVTEKEVSDCAEQIRGNLESISSRLPNLDMQYEPIKKFVDFYNSEKVPGVNKTLPVGIIDLTMRSVVDEGFINELFQIYKILKERSILFAEETDFGKKLDNINFTMVYIVISAVVLISLPIMVKLYYIITEKAEIAKAFSDIPVKDIRKSLINVDSTLKSTEYSTDLQGGNKGYDNIFIGILMFLTVAPVIIGCVTFFFFGMSYVQESNEKSKNAAYIKLGTATTRITFIAMMQAFQETYVGDDAVGINKSIVKESMRIATLGNKESADDITKSTLRVSSTIFNWLDKEDEYRTMHPPLDESNDKIPAVGAGFERLAFQKWLHAEDNIVFLFSISYPGDVLSLMYYNFLAYILWWMYERREIPYFETITNSLISSIYEDNNMVIIVTIIIICIVIAYLVTFAVLYYQRMKIREALLMLLQLKPTTVLKCESIMSVITRGRDTSEPNDMFRKSNSFVKYVDYGITKVDSKFNVFDKNLVFEKIVPNINNLNEIEETKGEQYSVNALLSKVRVAFSGKEPQISLKISFNIRGEPHFFNVDIIAVAGNRLAFENDTEKVDYCILIFKETTEFINSEKIVAEKNSELISMLNKALPPNIVSILNKGENNISFNVHSITMGEISVRASKRFSFTTKDPHIFYHKVYQRLDEIMENYPILCKVRTLAHNYTFAGGLFMDVNKPEKHAEETIKFLFDVIKAIPSISKECQTEVSLKIFVHTGGPVTAGVMSIEMPSFIVIGSIHKYIHELKILDESNVIHITRSVYELIFSAGFNITESESIIVGNEKIPTYTIYPLSF